MGYDKFEKIKQNLIQLARDRKDIYAAIEFGSQARTKQKADYYMEQDEWLEHIGEPKNNVVVCARMCGKGLYGDQ